MIGIGRAGRRVNRLDHRGEDLHTAVELPQVGLHRAADIVGQGTALFAQQAIEGAGSEVMHQHPAGGAADQCRHIGAVIGGRQGRLVAQADTVDKPHVHVDDLEALLVAAAAGDHLGFFVHMAGIPQAVGAGRRQAFGRFELGWGGSVDAGRQFMDHAVFHRQHAAQRPGQADVQSGAEDFHGLAETLVDAAALERHFADPAQQPTHREDHRQHRGKRPAHIAEGPDLAQVDAEAVVQFMLQCHQRLRRPTQQAGDKAGGDQPWLEAFTTGAEQRQQRPQQQLRRHQGRQQADQRGQARRPQGFRPREQQAQGTEHQHRDRDPDHLGQGLRLRPFGNVGLGELTLQHQQGEPQRQAQRRRDGSAQSQARPDQRQVPALLDTQQRQQRPAGQPQRVGADLRQGIAPGTVEALDQALVDSHRLKRWRHQLIARDRDGSPRLLAPTRHAGGRLQRRDHHQQRGGVIAQQGRPDRSWRKEPDKEPQHQAAEREHGQADAQVSQPAGVEARPLEARQTFQIGPRRFKIHSHVHSRPDATTEVIHRQNHRHTGTHIEPP